MTGALRSIAEECCGGRIVLATEGGYDLHALAASLDAVVQVLAGPPAPAAWPAPGPDRSARGRESAGRAKQALAPFWKL
jgi:acetoin utilization deacetylase AcuC-like enzyme